MSEIWLVTAGSYSNYRVVMAFTTEALAKDYIQRWTEQRHGTISYGDGLNDPEPCVLLDSPAALPRISWIAHATVRDGAIFSQDVRARELAEDSPMPQYDVSVTEVRKAAGYMTNSDGVQIEGPDRDEALRLVREWAAEKNPRAP